MTVFKTGTILERKEKKDDAYDQIIIVGANPTKLPDVGDWVGAGGPDFLIQPRAGFGDTIAMTAGQAAHEYTIIHDGDGLAVNVPAGTDGLPDTPENVFAREAAKAEGHKSPAPPEEQVKIVEKEEVVKTNGEDETKLPPEQKRKALKAKAASAA